MCWWYRKYAPRNIKFETLEQIARKEKRGLLVEPNPTPPWEFRHGKASKAGPVTPTDQGNIVGNRNSHVYPLPGCPGYNAMKEKNKVYFKSEAEAAKAGFRSAGNCRKKRSSLMMINLFSRLSLLSYMQHVGRWLFRLRMLAVLILTLLTAILLQLTEWLYRNRFHLSGQCVNHVGEVGDCLLWNWLVRIISPFAWPLWILVLSAWCFIVWIIEIVQDRMRRVDNKKKLDVYWRLE